MTQPSSDEMRLVNEITEVASLIRTLATYTYARHKTMLPPEALLIRAQAEAMGVYSKMLAARLALLTGGRACKA